MLDHLMNESNITLTENGAVTHSTTGSDCLDFFASAGALRSASEGQILKLFIRAYNEDADSAMKLIFFARDIRGGLGERRVFRTALKWLAENKPESARKNLESIAEFGRYDDLLVLIGTPLEADAVQLIDARLGMDIAAMRLSKPVSLLAKWLPSVNASNKETVRTAKRLAKLLKMSEAEYRKHLSELRAYLRIIENALRERDYSFDYEKQPSRALFKYREAFRRNDLERYSAFLTASIAGKAKLNASNVYPYELVQTYLASSVFGRHADIPEKERAALNATWEALPDYGADGDMLAVVDTSGSMYSGSAGAPLPAAVAFSLGLYFAERNKGAFRGHFIEFSRKAKLIKLKGETFCDRLQYAASFCEVANTDVDAVFNLILRTAVKNKLPQQELPQKLVFISDMEFDMCTNNSSLSNFENAKRRFAEHGYALPSVIFWNVASRHGHQPVRMNEQGVTLVSGASPVLFSMVAGGSITPMKFMLNVLESERYAGIAA
ncbi:MAG: DUF2828 family protein [Clostridia bacterium]|nr:DUF2828 family protein [Clostridia bacterium]